MNTFDNEDLSEILEKLGTVISLSRAHTDESWKIKKLKGAMECPVIEYANIHKAMKEKNKAMENEYEAFDLMYAADGIYTKCPRKL